MTFLRRIWIFSFFAFAIFAALDRPAVAFAQEAQPPPANKDDDKKGDDQPVEETKVTPEEAQKFFSATVTANQSLQAAAVPLGEAIRPIFADKPADIEGYEKAYKGIDKALAEVERAAREWKVPESDAAQAYFKKYQQFLQTQRNVFEDDLAKLKDALSDGNLASDAKRKKAIELLKSIDKKVAVVHAPLREAQNVFAEEFKLKVVPAKIEEEGEE